MTTMSEKAFPIRTSPYGHASKHPKLLPIK